ncbi:E3 ubiquitin-protein ligase TRIM71-like [Mytilus trossulus]|uniref:E3 ubiquitin-protein ligase TRIM71-like n=1 Tax=Mytilus trossulus TaxID=6551 RepID=UPI003006FE68
MASASFCDPCSEADRSLTATKYCSDCEERLCTDCAVSHCRLNAFKSHHVIDVLSIGTNTLISTKKNCHVHSDMLSDYFCTDHEIVCCRACISNEHWVCKNVLPMELASKDVKKSALFNDVMEDMTHLITTFNALNDNRQSNLQSIEKCKPAVTKQIAAWKSKLLKQIDELEHELTVSFSSLQRKHEMEINKQKQEISQVLVDVIENKNEMNFLREHGSNNQLFIYLHQQVANIHSAEAKIQEMVFNSQEIDITFNEKKDVKLLEYVQPSQIQYKPRKFQQAQIIAAPMKRIVGFERDTEVKLKTKVNYALRSVSITNDNKLLLTNPSSAELKVYVYRDCKDYETEITMSSRPFDVAVIPGTDRAVVTLPDEKSIQFINTTTMTKDNKVDVGFTCYGITAGGDRIYVGGEGGYIKTLDNNGKILKTIQQGTDYIIFMVYNNLHDQLIVRCRDKLFCVQLDRTLIHSKYVSGVAGVALDRQGNI